MAIRLEKNKKREIDTSGDINRKNKVGLSSDSCGLGRSGITKYGNCSGFFFALGSMKRFSEEGFCLCVYGCARIYGRVSGTCKPDHTFERAILNITFDGFWVSRPDWTRATIMHRRMRRADIKASLCAEESGSPDGSPRREFERSGYTCEYLVSTND